MELTATPADIEAVTTLLGRRPRGAFKVVVRDADGLPVVIQNAPYLDDGTPMPTLYWLTGAEQIKHIGRLEAEGGVDHAERDVDPEALQAAHDRYAAERDELLQSMYADRGEPRPSGGVGGTRVGVKCLHAHYAYYLAGGDDPVGAWIARQLRKTSGHP